MAAPTSIDSSSGIKPCPDSYVIHRPGRFQPAQHADPAVYEEARASYEALRHHLDSALQGELPPWDRVLLEHLSGEMDQWWIDLHEDGHQAGSAASGGAEMGTSKAGTDPVTHQATILFEEFTRCVASVESHVLTVSERWAATRALAGGERGVRAEAGSLAEHLQQRMTSRYDNGSPFISMASAIEVGIEPTRTLGGPTVALPTSPIGMASLVVSAIDAGRAVHDMVDNGVGVQNSADLGASGMGLVGGLIAGPAGPLLSAFSAGYSSGKLIDRRFGVSDTIAGVRGDFMPEDLEAMRRRGVPGLVQAEALSLQARIWDEGYQWYLQATGEHAPEYRCEYSAAAAARQRGLPQFRGYDDGQLLEHVSSLPSELRLAVIRHVGERACGLPGGLPPVPENPPVDPGGPAEGHPLPAYHSRIQP